MQFLTTPEASFQSIQDYPYQANYLSVDDTEGGTLKLHYIDEGPKEGDVILMLHGEPSWSYLYRKMIPIFANNGYRAIAPDLTRHIFLVQV